MGMYSEIELSCRGISNEYLQPMFLWKTLDNYPSIIIKFKYPPHLFHCLLSLMYTVRICNVGTLAPKKGSYHFMQCINLHGKNNLRFGTESTFLSYLVELHVHLHNYMVLFKECAAKHVTFCIKMSYLY